MTIKEATVVIERYIGDLEMTVTDRVVVSILRKKWVGGRVGVEVVITNYTRSQLESYVANPTAYHASEYHLPRWLSLQYGLTVEEVTGVLKVHLALNEEYGHTHDYQA